MEKVYLYVEKYDKTTKELLLDYINENEFLFTRNLGDYVEEMHLYGYEPSMILIENFDANIKLNEGYILEINASKLIELFSAHYRLEQSYFQELPANVFIRFSDFAQFKEYINLQTVKIIKNLSYKFTNNIKDTWEGYPCALNNLGDSFKVTVWDVGQGNTNVIEHTNNITFFDFGASIYYTRSEQKQIIKSHYETLNCSKRKSMIISHWDVDHYNLLCSVDDDFLRKLCCVFLPENPISLTAKQVVKRLEDNCKFINVIKSPKRTLPQKTGIQVWNNGTHYFIFSGEKSKNKNVSGNALVVFGRKDVCMLTADHSNYQVWDIMYNKVNQLKLNGQLNIVVPHHGGKAGKLIYTSIKNAHYALISVGKNNYYHPFPEITKYYMSSGFHIKRTDWERKDITIDIT